MNKKVYIFIAMALLVLGLFGFTLFYQGFEYKVVFREQGYSRHVDFYSLLKLEKEQGYSRTRLSTLVAELEAIPGVASARRLPSAPRSALWEYEVLWDAPVALISYDTATYPVSVDGTLLEALKGRELLLPRLNQKLKELPPYTLPKLKEWYSQYPGLEKRIEQLWLDSQTHDIIIKPRAYDVSIRLSIRTQVEMIQTMFRLLESLKEAGTLDRYADFSIYGEEIYYVLRRSA